MRQPDYDRGETIDDVADEAYDLAVQEQLDGPDFNTEANLHADTVTERHDNLAIGEDERCPSCRIGLGEHCHAQASFAIPETDYMRCERCGHQWGHE